MGGDNQTQRVEIEARSFYEEEEDDEHLRDQEGEEEDYDAHHVQLPKKATANAGSPGSGGSAATPAKSLRDDDSCPQLAEESQFDVSM